MSNIQEREIERLEQRIAELEAEIAALRQEQKLMGDLVTETEESAEKDTARLDWLETKIVNVATPLRYGSRQEFKCENVAAEEDAPRSEVRKAIDAAIEDK